MRILILLAIALLGCASPRDAAVVTVNGAGEFLTDAEHALAALDRGAQEDALSHGSNDAARAELIAVQARYHAAWVAYRRAKAAWLSAAAGVRAYDDAERANVTHSVADYAAAVAELVTAEREFMKATAALRTPVVSK